MTSSPTLGIGQSTALNRYAYDAEGRLSASAPATGELAPVTRYAHNALGQRMFKTEPLYVQAQQPPGEQSLWEQFLAFFGLLWSPQTQPSEQLGWAFVYDEEGTLLSEMGMGGPSGTGATHHIWLPTSSGPMPIAAVVNGSKLAVHADHLNTPRRLTNESAQAVWQWAYSAFGDEEPTRAANRFAHPSTGFTSVQSRRGVLRTASEVSLRPVRWLRAWPLCDWATAPVN